MGAGWSSGISVYGVVALVGVAGCSGWIEAPSFVEQWWVIGAAVVLFFVEFVIDKIALLDTAWDSVHTLIRPAVGGYLMSTATDTQLSVPALAVSGVLLALSSHSAKAATCLTRNLPSSWWHCWRSLRSWWRSCCTGSPDASPDDSARARELRALVVRAPAMSDRRRSGSAGGEHVATRGERCANHGDR